MLLKDSMCDVCKHHAAISDRTLREMASNEKININGVCKLKIATNREQSSRARQQLLYHLLVSTQKLKKISTDKCMF